MTTAITSSLFTNATPIFSRAMVYVLALVFLGFSGNARADFELGMKYYSQSNFEKAFREFQQAAKFGDMSAQFNLGVMYFRGEFVSQDSVNAYAWLALAAA